MLVTTRIIAAHLSLAPALLQFCILPVSSICRPAASLSILRERRRKISWLRETFYSSVLAAILPSRTRKLSAVNVSASCCNLKLFIRPRNGLLGIGWLVGWSVCSLVGWLELNAVSWCLSNQDTYFTISSPHSYTTTAGPHT